MQGRLRDMKERKPLTDDEGEVRELMSADLKQFRRARVILSPELLKKLDIQEASAQQERVTIQLSRDIVEKFRATGKGWQTRLDAALRDWLQTHSPG
jgi:uncharacterized protein (DUF4415 family)